MNIALELLHMGLNKLNFLKTLRVLKIIAHEENILLFPFNYVIFLLNVKINFLKKIVSLKLKKNKKIDVLLINPPRWKIQEKTISYIARRISKEEPMGLTSISAFLKTKGYNVRILDWNIQHLTTTLLKYYIQALKPKIIGISAITLQINKAYHIGNYIKKNFPKISLVYGGVHPSFFPKEPFKKGFADFVIIGEGEETFLELLKKIKSYDTNFNIDGLAYKDDTHIKINKPRKLIENIDNLPLPDRTNLPIEKYNTSLHIPSLNKEKTIPIMTSRGCPFNCSYCAIPNIWMRKFRQRSPENIIKEIKRIIKTYNINHFHFYDDDFFININFVKKLCKLITKENLKIKWLCQTGSSTLVKHADILPEMRKSGCVLIELGIESCDQQVLTKINKPETIQDIEIAIGLLAKNNIKPLILMMSFNQGENLDSVYNTTLLLEKLKLWDADYLSDQKKYINQDSPAECNGTPYLHGFFATPIPGSNFYKEANKKGIVLIDNWDDSYFRRINFIPNEFLNDSSYTLMNLNYNEFCDYLNKFKPILKYYLRSLVYVAGNFSKLDEYKKFLFHLYNLSRLNDKKTIKELSRLVIAKYRKENISTVCLGFRFLAMFKIIKSNLSS